MKKQELNRILDAAKSLARIENFYSDVDIIYHDLKHLIESSTKEELSSPEVKYMLRNAYKQIDEVNKDVSAVRRLLKPYAPDVKKETTE